MKHRATMPAPSRASTTPPGAGIFAGVGVCARAHRAGEGSYIQGASEKKSEKKSARGVAGVKALQLSAVVRGNDSAAKKMGGAA